MLLVFFKSNSLVTITISLNMLLFNNESRVHTIVGIFFIFIKCFGFFSALNLDPDPDANTIARLFIFKRLFIFIS